MEQEAQSSKEHSEDIKRKNSEYLQSKEKGKTRKVKEVKEKKPRGYSFISAFSDWRKEQDWKGLCPAKGTKEYDEIRAIYDNHKGQQK